MLFSFVVPVYNQVSEIRTILSHLEEIAEFWDCEIIIIDDNSSDGTYDFLANSQTNKKICVFRTGRNSGPGIARNLGIEHANGKYITFLDSDDTIEFIKENIPSDEILSFQKEMVDVIRMDCKNESRGNFSSHVPKLPAILINDLDSKLKYEDFPAKECWGIFFLNDLLNSQNIRFPNLRYAEDQVFMTDVRLKMKSIASTSLFTYIHKANNTGLATKFEQDGIFYLSECIQLIFDRISKSRGNQLNFLKIKIRELFEIFFWYAIAFYKKNSLVEAEIKKNFLRLQDLSRISVGEQFTEFNKIDEFICYRNLLINFLNLKEDNAKKNIELYCLSYIGMAIATLCMRFGKPVHSIIDDARISKDDEDNFRFGAMLKSRLSKNINNHRIIICHPSNEVATKICIKIKNNFISSSGNIFMLSKLNSGPLMAS
jgi:glycosyltransferase involved in cell wall biosynthesis